MKPCLRLSVKRFRARNSRTPIAVVIRQDKFGLEYDLGIYNIVAVNDFNMGAMENKGLNVFNTAYVLADPSTATDSDYER